MKILSSIYVLMAVALLSACHKAELVNISQPVIQAGNAIKSDTLAGSVKGTMLSGKTYYFKSDITVNDGDTLLMQSGVKLIAIGDGTTWQKSPQISVHGTFISLGTKDQPNYITVSDAQRKYENAFGGIWGGIVCSPAAATTANPTPLGGDLILKWTHVEFAGGPSGPNNDPAIYKQGDARYMIYFANLQKNFILEDSWIYGSKDDAIRTVGGKISIMRNTFEACGQAGGECFNMKSGTVGDLAYNMLIGSATNALKASNSGNSTVQCNVNMYNNTMVNCGFRQTKTGRGGSINYEQGARGMVYNNLIVNCRFGLRVVSDADVQNLAYDYQEFYGSTQAIVNQFNASDGVATSKTHDIRSTTPKQNNPQFYGYNVDQYDFTANAGPISVANQPQNLITMGTSNFRIQATSPGSGKGKTDFSPMAAVKATGNYGTTITQPGKDIGAYQLDGTGNQH